ncbi:MAG: prolipoprotein diacylglyceryl transferase [Oscillospiraceae bacterium]|jgi:phosphatidylglycerol:prolipoprotein diacylglycerol transferase|nr:prolipoprotein diacylglyceryl transferase [Oscillospiraceae bacterium]
MHPYLHVLGHSVPMYWLCGFAGLVLASGLAMLRRRAARFRTPADDILHMILLCMVGALVGAKLLQVVGLLISRAAQPGFWTIETWTGIINSGGVFYGGLIGGGVAGAVYIRKYKLDARDVFDILAPSVLLFHAFGRVGCFFAGCCYGREAAWGIAFTQSLGAPNGVPLIPVQLFEAGFDLLLLAAMLIFRPERKRPGLLLPLYLAAYASARFVLEFFRGDIGRGVLLLSTSQWISLLILPAAAVLLARTISPASRRPQAGQQP